MQGLFNRLFRKTPKLKCFEEEYIRQGGNLYAFDLGLSQVPLAQIVGVAARCQDERRKRQGGWKKAVAQTKRRLRKGEPIPPLRLYKLGSDLYLVEGQAEVTAAKELRLTHLEGRITEYLLPTSTLDGLLRRERDEFIYRTGLTEIHLTFPGRYPLLLQQIRGHHRYLEQTRGHLFLFPEAVADWWQNMYGPVVSGLQGDRILDGLPGFTVGDVYSYLTEHLAKEADSLRIPLSKAIADLVNIVGATWRDKLASIIPPCFWEAKCSRP